MTIKNIYRPIAAIALIIATALTARGVETDVTPGNLHTLIDNPQSVSSLSLTGSVNAADLFFIAENMPALRELDLSRVSIAAFDNGRERLGLSAYHKADVIPAGVFAGLRLTSVKLPQSDVLSIGDVAFAGSSLTRADIGSNVKSVGQGAFSACPQLKEMTLAVSDIGGSHVFDDCLSLSKVTLTGVNVIPASTFEGCTALNAVTGLENVTSVGDRAFEGCSVLSAVSFGKNLKSIGAEAFAGTALESADLSTCSFLNHIGRWAFARCADLQRASLPASLKTVGEAIFFDCKSLAQLTLPSGAVSIGDFALKGLGNVSELTLPASLDSIGDYAMASMDGLKYINASALESVPELGKEVWHGVVQPTVRLLLDAKTIDLFASAGQWMEFDILNIEQSSADDITLTETQKPSVTGRFEGTALFVRADRDIAALRVFDTSGRLLASSDIPAGMTETQIAVPAATGIIIVEVILTDGIRAGLKIRK